MSKKKAEEKAVGKQIGGLTLYTVKELSSLLDVQEATIRSYLKEKKLKGKKLAGIWYVTENQLREYFEGSEDE